MSAFETLLAELGSAADQTTTLAKSLAAADTTAGGGGADTLSGGGGSDTTVGGGGADTTAGGQGGNAMAKSFMVKLADGSEAEAFDGSELLKSLMTRLDENDSVLSKAFSQTLGIVKQQGEMIKSLSEQVKVLGGQGRGRKTMISVHERTNAVEQSGAQGGGQGGQSGQSGLMIKGFENISAGDFMLKATSAYEAKKLNGVDLGTIDVCLRTGQPIDETLIAKVVSASAGT